MLNLGIKGIAECIADDTNSAKAMGSGELDVFATPSMIALMEKSASECVKSQLQDGFGTVGILININHVSATPFGMKVYAESELIEIDGKRLVFSVKAFDESGLIGEGRHERFVINNEKFMLKTTAKKG